MNQYGQDETEESSYFSGSFGDGFYPKSPRET